MGLMVLAYPEISDKDFNWIQNHREKNDRYYNILNPHFTIVFPVYDLKEEEFIDHIKKTSGEFSKFDFTLRSSIVVKDSFSDFWDVLLVPDEGNSMIIKMHDSLYRGILITQLRIDIPYISHMTIGNDIDGFHCFNMAKEVNNADIIIKGTINNLTIARYDGITLENIEVIPLK
jgi:2'-5' RNA ligase